MNHGTSSTTRRSIPAFTLVETLVAIALLGALSIGMVGFLRELRDGEKNLNQTSGQLVGTGVLFDAIERATATSVAWNAGGAPGFRGTADSLRIAHLVVVIPSPIAAPPSAEPQVLEVRSDGAGTVLMRRTAADDSASTAEPVLTGVRELRLRYHDGTQWLDSFDSASRRALPRAIEVAIWFGEPASPAAPGTAPSLDDAPQASPPPDTDESMAQADLGEPDRLRIIAIPDGGEPEAPLDAEGFADEPDSGTSIETTPTSPAPEGP